MGSADNLFVIEVSDVLAVVLPPEDVMYKPDAARPAIRLDASYGSHDNEVAPPRALFAWPQGGRWFYEVHEWDDSTRDWRTIWPERFLCDAWPVDAEIYVSGRLVSATRREVARQRQAVLENRFSDKNSRAYALDSLDARLDTLSQALDKLRRRWASNENEMQVFP